MLVDYVFDTVANPIPKEMSSLIAASMGSQASYELRAKWLVSCVTASVNMVWFARAILAIPICP